MIKRREIPQQGELHRLFDYVDGNLVWKVDVARNVKAGSVAGSYGAKKYASVQINKRMHSVHRIIYAWHHGSVPDVIDHVDGDPRNNRIDNLRPATSHQNSANQKLHVNNKSGVKGVSQRKDGRWRVFMRIGGGRTCEHTFRDFDKACAVANAERIKHHGEFARLG